MTGREHHENISFQKDVLHRLRMAERLTKMVWENEHRGSRLAPAVNLLRTAWGFEIGGDGSTESPYFMLDVGQLPSRCVVTEHIKNAYYDSEHWKQIRANRIGIDGARCVLCWSEENLRVHHVIYNLFEETPEELMTVCDTCHDRMHKQSRLKFPNGITAEQAHKLGFGKFPEWVIP